MNLKHTLCLAVALLMAGSFSVAAFAQPKPQVTVIGEMSNTDLDMAELHSFDTVAVAHKNMALRLAANPKLAEEKYFLKRYPDLERFFASHPGSRERFLANPGNYLPGVHMHHEMRSAAGRSAAAKSEKPQAAATPKPAAPAAANRNSSEP